MSRVFLIFLALIFTAAAVFAGGSVEVSPTEDEDGFKRVEAEEVELRWMVDGQDIRFEITAPTTGWISIGFNPSRAMKDAQMIFGFVQDGNVTISDQFGDGVFSHKADTALGGSNNLSSTSGSEENGRTTLRFDVPIDSGDQYDTVLTPGETHVLLIAYGPDGEDNFSTKHAFRAKTELQL